MCLSPNSGEAITRFDRLLEDVTRSLQVAPVLVDHRQGAPTSAAGAAGAWADGAAQGPRSDPADLAQVMLRAVATVPPGITASAPDMPLVYANDAFTGITGYSMMEILGRNCRFLQGADTDPAPSSAPSMTAVTSAS